MADANPSCPRCGYDQSGIIAAWQESCPLDGVCSECGLDFAWRDILNPEYGDLPDFFEHARRRFARTWRRALRPWRFWRWVRMEHRIIPRRAAFMAAAGMVLSHVVLALAVFAVYSVAMLVGPLLAGWGSIFGPNGWEMWQGIGANAAWPMGHHMKVYILQRSSVRLDTFVRPLELVAVLTVLVMPLTFFLLGTTLRRAKVRWAHIARVWGYGLIWLPVAFHLPGFFTGLTLVTDLVLTALLYHSWSVSNVTDALARLDTPLTLALVCLWMTLWWVFACGRYLRLPHAWAVGLVMTFLAALISLVAVVTLWNRAWMGLWL